MTEQPVYLKEILKDHGMEDVLFTTVADIAEDDTYADTWVVPDDHRVAECGTHRELMEKRGIYYNLVMAQLSMAKL